jgi:acyl carrier protein
MSGDPIEDGSGPTRLAGEERVIPDLAPRLLQLVRDLADELRPETGLAEFAKHLGLDHSLERDYGLDSLSRAELLLRIERELGVAPEEAALSEAETPRDLLRALLRVAVAAPARAARASAPVPLGVISGTNEAEIRENQYPPIRSPPWSKSSTGTHGTTATGC